ncbi:DUF1178 family protein [Pelagibacteraceae bacterium]|jgi:hypothetical protein|nr:DUF1178 family protein [Pelagibacteraceae bacterium]
MIKYILKCKEKHEFESWFSSSREFEKLKKKKLIECIFCKSQEISKSIMSPNITGKKHKDRNTTNRNDFIKIKNDLIKIKNYVEKNYEFVGDKFSREVREIFYDNKKKKNIYGTASLKEKQELEDEGIELATIPWIDNKEN